MPAFLRRLVVWALVLGVGYWYAETYGAFIGFPPFTPVYLWNYTGERTYEVVLEGTTDGLKVKLQGELAQGRMRVWVSRGERRVSRVATFERAFQKTLKWKLAPGRYTVHFAFEDARGWVRLDWVTSKFEGW